MANRRTTNLWDLCHSKPIIKMIDHARCANLPGLNNYIEHNDLRGIVSKADISKGGLYVNFETNYGLMHISFHSKPGGKSQTHIKFNEWSQDKNVDINIKITDNIISLNYDEQKLKQLLQNEGIINHLQQKGLTNCLQQSEKQIFINCLEKSIMVHIRLMIDALANMLTFIIKENPEIQIHNSYGRSQSNEEKSSSIYSDFKEEDRKKEDIKDRKEEDIKDSKDYKQKYLKYKQKYIKLKKLLKIY